MLAVEGVTVELKPGPVSLDAGIIVAVKEHLSEENLAKCYTARCPHEPGHTYQRRGETGHRGWRT